MTTLSIHRRDRRARAPKRRKRRNLVKFIPNADRDFAFMAQKLFLDRLKQLPSAGRLDNEQLAEIEDAVLEFRSALARAGRDRHPDLVRQKEESRQHAEEVIRRLANIIRANPQISVGDKIALRLKKRRDKSPRNGWQNPPLLRFLGSGDGVSVEAGTGNGSGVHVLEVRSHAARHAQDRELGVYRRTKPDGAVRLELFVDLVPVGQDVPHHPAELTGRAWYLRSFTTSRIEVSYPIPSEPMLVVYWARWADGRGGVGRFSEPCPAHVEGWTSVRPALPGAGADGASPRVETKIVFVQVSRLEPDALPSAEEFEEIEAPRRRLLTTERRELEEAV